MSKVKKVSFNEFEQEVEQHQGLTLVDFYAEWCGPCKSIAPLVDILAEENVNKIKVVKVDTEEASQVSAKYGVRGLPTLMLFKDGSPIANNVGAAPLNTLRNFLQQAS